LKRLSCVKLKEWSTKKNRKPLILQGARQVGKSYLVKEFGKSEFKNFIRIDFLSQKEFHLIFDEKKSIHPKAILKDISFLIKKEIIPNETLLFFDEIQECAGALTSLKFFQEEIPELALIAAGSYLGIIKNESAFPVGKVEFLGMAPMNFEEFLMNDEALYEEYKKISIKDHEKINSLYHQKLLEAWRTYQAIGGMPEVVKTYFSMRKRSELNACLAARKIQEQLIIGYKADFSKHSGTVNSAHILSVFESIPTQLFSSYDESVSKFSFTGVVPKQKGFERIKGPLTWLVQSRLVIQSLIVSKSEHPLKAHTLANKFKLYFFDVGLLNAMLELPIEVLLQNEIGAYKGFIAENFVAQELFFNSNSSLYSWTEGRSEVEFLLVLGKDIVPLEVKSSERSVRAKSLDSYIERYYPSHAYKLSSQNRGFDQKRKMLTMPIYLAGKI
jgi:predicted AAA+ superfamily ATPase